MREIGEGDESALTDAQQMVEHLVGRARGLQRLAEDRIVEPLVGIAGQIDIGIALHHRQPARDGRGDIGRIDLQPARIHPRLVAQRRHQLPVAAADIQHAGAACDMVGDDRQIGA